MPPPQPLTLPALFCCLLGKLPVVVVVLSLHFLRQRKGNKTNQRVFFFKKKEKKNSYQVKLHLWSPRRKLTAPPSGYNLRRGKPPLTPPTAIQDVSDAINQKENNRVVSSGATEPTGRRDGALAGSLAPGAVCLIA